MIARRVTSARARAQGCRRGSVRRRATRGRLATPVVGCGSSGNGGARTRARRRDRRTQHLICQGGELGRHWDGRAREQSKRAEPRGAPPQPLLAPARPRGKGKQSPSTRRLSLAAEGGPRARAWMHAAAAEDGRARLWGAMGRYGEIWGDMGRYGEIWGGIGRYGEHLRRRPPSRGTRRT